MKIAAVCRNTLLLTGLFVLGLTSAVAADWPRQVTDSRGVHTLESKPTRIVSTSVTLTGSLLAIDAPVIASGATTPNNRVADAQGFLRQWGDIAKQRKVARLYIGEPSAEAVVYTAAAHTANLWTTDSAQGKLLHQLGFTLADVPAGLHTSKSQGKRHDIIQLGGENLATGLNGEGLFVFAGDQKDVDAIYANPLLAHLPSVKNKRVWALGTETFRLDYYSAMLVLQRLNSIFK